MRFVDTNVLLYAVSSLANEAGKREVALQLMSEDDLAVSVQVLQEFYYQATRSNRMGRLSHDDAMGFIERLVGMRVQPVTLDVFHEAVSTSHRFGITYWEGAILAAARAQDCDAVYSEDLSPEQDYDGVRVINPFAGVGIST